jgi:hypothetical protein
MTPRVILETDLHNDCGLIAAAAWRYLDSHGVKARILNIRYGPRDGHTVVVFAQGPTRLACYDHEGSLIFDSTATWATRPKLLAKAWARENAPRKRVTDGKWVE